MRVWVIENTPDYDQPRRVGFYPDPMSAWSTLYEEVNHYVLHKSEVKMTLGADDRDHPESDVSIEIITGVNDHISLTGVYVEGTGDPKPTGDELRQLEDLGVCLIGVFMAEAGFDGAVGEAGDHSGSWTFTKPEGTWTFTKPDSHLG